VTLLLFQLKPRRGSADEKIFTIYVPFSLVWFPSYQKPLILHFAYQLARICTMTLNADAPNNTFSNQDGQLMAYNNFNTAGGSVFIGGNCSLAFIALAKAFS
jgi:hypothetical protein